MIQYPTTIYPNLWVEMEFSGSPSLTDNPPVPSNLLFDSSLFLREKITSDIRYDGINKSLPIYINHGSHMSWDGSWLFSYTATYEFIYTTDDGMRFYIDGNLISLPTSASSWIDQAPTLYKVKVPVSKGYHNIRVEWYNKRASSGIAMFDWRLAEQAVRVTPVSSNIQKNYTAGSHTPIPSEDLLFENVSENYVLVTCICPPGLNVVPPSITMDPHTAQIVKLNFDPAVVDQYALGLNKATCELQVVAALGDAGVGIPIGILPSGG